MSVINYIFDLSNPLKPYSMKMKGNPELPPPSNATRIEPEFKEGFVPCWDGEKWNLIKDHRGMTIYNTETKEPSISMEINIPEGYTVIEPTDKYSVWENGEWVINRELKDAAIIEERRIQRYTLQNNASIVIEQLNDILLSTVVKMDSKDVSKYEASLNAWKEYRVQLNLLNPMSDDFQLPEEPINLLR